MLRHSLVHMISQVPAVPFILGAVRIGKKMSLSTSRSQSTCPLAYETNTDARYLTHCDCCKLDLLSEMPRCFQGIDSSRCQSEMLIYLSGKPDLLLAIPTCPKMFPGIPRPRRYIFPLARQEFSPFASWGTEKLIHWQRSIWL